MAGLVATPNISQAEAAITIASDGWFPAVSLAQVREDLVLDGTITTTRLRRAIRHGIAQVNNELRAWKDEQVQATGAANLAAVPSETIDGEHVKSGFYFRAVCGYVEADLFEKHRGYDLTAEGQRRAEMLDARIGEARRNAFWALQDIRGLPHTVSGLV
ncbi:head completion/stabilization protein [Lysobacter brunescens]|uniref:Head completion/stabilization protein n=1 Tax=Lysobacter brunescens TaxID=262323 RepID=A0ABW2YEZ8_9GAMM